MSTIALGPNTISKVMVGANEVPKMYLGNSLVYENVPAGPFVAEGVEFNGVNDYLNRQTANVTDNLYTGLINSWFYVTDLTGAAGLVRSTPLSATDLTLDLKTSPSDGKLNCILRDEVGIAFHNNEFIPYLNTWHHVLYSWDLASPVMHLYIDNVEYTTHTIPPQNRTVNWASTSRSIAQNGGFNLPFIGDLSEMFISQEYLDLSIEANRRKFITADGIPVDLGPTGALPTGTSPLIYFSGNAAAWNSGVNKGTGGDFTMSGAVTDSVNEPVELPPDVDFFVGVPVDFVTSVSFFISGIFEWSLNGGISFTQESGGGEINITGVPSADVIVRAVGSGITKFNFFLPGTSGGGYFSSVVMNEPTGTLVGVSGSFTNNSAMVSCDISLLNFSNVTSITNLFKLCTGLVNLNVDNLDLSSSTTISSVFENCSSLTDIDLTTWNVNTVGNNFGFMFNLATSLESVKIPWLHTPNTSSLFRMFDQCTALVCLDGIDTTTSTNISDLFVTNTALIAPDATEQTALMTGANYINANTCP